MSTDYPTADKATDESIDINRPRGTVAHVVCRDCEFEQVCVESDLPAEFDVARFGETVADIHTWDTDHDAESGVIQR
jgi:hypothetical protein